MGKAGKRNDLLDALNVVFVVAKARAVMIFSSHTM